jgi:hypothetical protein
MMFVRALGLLAVLALPAPVLAATRAELVERAEILERAWGERGFTVLVEEPFVVIGDDPPERVRDRARGLVRWSVRLLEKDFFEKRPGPVLEVWLFKNARSYQKHAWKIFREKPSTPFGWYSPEHKALIMNIGTGGGTLVHEIVHPYVEADFPDAPAWLNEGLGSLFEGVTEKHGRIWGVPNWRLPALRDGLRAGEVPSLRALLRTDTDQFYEMDHGYAQARYLCLWLQDNGLIVDFYKKLRAGGDPVKTLEELTGRKLDAFQREWEAWVLGLKFRGR